MSDKETPSWAQHLITEVLSLKDSFKNSFNELNESINGLKKDTGAILNRLTNTEKRIGATADAKTDLKIRLPVIFGELRPNEV